MGRTAALEPMGEDRIVSRSSNACVAAVTLAPAIAPFEARRRHAAGLQDGSLTARTAFAG